MSRTQAIFVKPQNKIPTPNTVNHGGYPAYARSLKEQYIQTLLTNTMGNTFYASGRELAKEATDMHTQMLANDPEFAARALVFARNEGFMRLQPIYGLVKLSSVNPALFEKVFDRVINIPSDLADFFTIMESEGRGQGGRAVKRAVGKFLNRISEYWAIKYSGRGRGFNLADAIATTHPKEKDEKQRAIFRYLLGKSDVDFSLIPQIAAYEKLKKATTSTEKIEAIREGRLPHEVVTGVGGLTKEVWDAVVKEMPTFALLRNLNTLERAGVLDPNRQLIESRFADSAALEKSKILPFRFTTAFHEVSKSWVKDSMRQAVELTFNNLPDIEGRTAILLDISGSMNGQNLQTGSIFAFALYKKTKGNSVFYLFDTKAEDANPSLHDSILTQASRVHARGGTDTGCPVTKLIHDNEKVDNIILITDEQQNSGSPFYSRLVEYRNKLNRKAKAFVVDISPYKGASIPKDDKNNHYIYGWSDTVLDYIALTTQGYDNLVDTIAKMEL